MAKITVKALVDGQEKDVELDDEKLPNGLLSQSQHDARMSTEARSQFARGERAGIKKAVEDDATRTTVIDQLRSGGHLESDDDEGDGGDGKKSKRKPSPEEVEAIRADVRKRELEPLKAELEGLKQETDRSRRIQLRSELITAARQAGVADVLLEGDIADEDNIPAFVAMHERRFGYDGEKTKGFALKKGDGFEYAKQVTDKQPWKTPGEYVTDWAADP